MTDTTGESMTRIEARKIIRKHALTQYNATTVLLLLKLLDATFRKTSDNTEARIEMSSKRLMMAAGIQRKQLLRLLNQLAEDDILLDMECGEDVTCYLNLEPLTTLARYVDVQKAETKAQNVARTTAAREKRKALREAAIHEKSLQMVANFVKVHFELLARDNEARTLYASA
jgi:hypothetical protein